MYRDFFTSKWFIGGVAFLIVFGVACVFWYHYDTAPYKRDAVETAELINQLKQSENGQKDVKSSPVSSPVKDRIENKSEEQHETITNEVSELEQSSQPKKENPKVRMSPNGFGPLPKVPRDFPDKKFRWRNYIDHPNFELIARVKLKVWEEQRKYPSGAGFLNGKVYLIFPDTAYVRSETKYGLDGEVVGTTITEILWHPNYAPSDEQWRSPFFNYSKYLEDVIQDNNLKVIDFDYGGIEPYTYLNL